jgi:hypothetical protein|tara:strand:- start:46 stop:1065 length:1020 start_codon:yes stop_codon:yes gene_type:complete
VIYKDTPGYTFKKRIITKLKNIIPKLENQIRTHLVKQSNATPIARSFEAIGWSHDKAPIAVSVNSDNDEYFNLEWGFTRTQAASMKEWETIIVDVVEPVGKPVDVFSDKFLSNKHLGEAHTPNTKEDIVNGVLKAVESDMIKDEKSVVKAWILRVTPEMTATDRQNIYKSYKTQKSSNGPVRTWHQGTGLNSVKEYAEKNNIPFSGDKNFEKTGKMAFVTHYSTLTKVIGDCKKTYMEYDKQHPVSVIGYIDEPKAAPALYTQREDWMKNAQKDIDIECQWIQHIAKLAGADIDLDKVKKVLPIKLGGFLWQNQKPDNNNGGETKESGVVGIKGQHIKL